MADKIIVITLNHCPNFGEYFNLINPIILFITSLSILFLFSCQSAGDNTDSGGDQNQSHYSPSVLIGTWESFQSERSYEYEKYLILTENHEGEYYDVITVDGTYNGYSTSAKFPIEWEFDSINYNLVIRFGKGKMGGDDLNEKKIRELINRLSYTNYSSEIRFENENSFNYNINESEHRFIRSTEK